MTAPPNVPYVATVTDCSEITLVGAADLAFWKARLQAEGLHPFAADGKAEVVLMAVRSKWFIRFREFNVAMFVSKDADGASRDGLFLASAFNSSRSFAFVERHMFHTPYVHAAVELQVEPASFQVLDGAAGVIAARRGATTAATGSTDETWEGSLAIPSKPQGARERFFARLGGAQSSYAFAEGRDSLQITPSSFPVTQWLLDSHFTPHTWLVRPRAVHARSKTYPRS